jgi:hypothetical protein
MKKEQLKQIIKPLIKECLKEVLIEEGFTKMLSESVQKNEQPLVHKYQKPQQQVLQKSNLSENKKKLLDAIDNTGFDVFAGTEPLKKDKEIISSDPGVDISGLIGENKQVWKQTLNALSGKKVKE